MNPLLGIEERQRAVLDQLRGPNGELADMLTALLVTSCQFELSKLVAARLDLGSFADAAVGVLSQFATADSCALLLLPEDLPPVQATIGDWPTSDLDMPALLAFAIDDSRADSGVVSSPISIHTEPIGVLSAAGLPAALVAAGLIAKAADQISMGLELLLEAERLRRAAAAVHALEIVSTLDASFGEDQLSGLTAALAGLSNALGARLTFENPRLGGPMEFVRGKTEGEQILHTKVETLVDARLPLTVEIAWTLGRSEADLLRATEIIDALTSSLSRIEQNARLQQEVDTDPLTGAGNRRMGSRMLARAFNRAQRTNSPMAVLMLDLDKFKSVNDTLGHEIGDAVLVAFAGALLSTVRSYDVVARWGGEEFLIICPDTDLAGAQALASRVLRATPEACAHLLPEPRQQTVSIGVAVYPEGSDFPDGLVRAADKALYNAKAAGRNQFSVCEPALVGATR